ncbi:hypothetical protein NPIL_663261 [Nephila pilipes]|uniref:Uncharacterized protein n=1 Tax=Nephila pilipes TaxID=299642 RepID=A0A8X6MW98_NEPPI|nr:hypothetical protein NPIL_356401 [Nephila pilipes]GFS81015.1 hypothetical protein NPIL_424051 [Nephila pilipes]GFU45080.1 hypothetical protein NPIL_663261 [Nephila pilipes]
MSIKWETIDELSSGIWIQTIHELSTKLTECYKELDVIMYSFDDMDKKVNNTRNGMEYLEHYINRLRELLNASSAVINIFTRIKNHAEHIKMSVLNIYVVLNRLRSEIEKDLTVSNSRKRELSELLNALQANVESIVGIIISFLGTLNSIKNEFFY